MALTSEQSTWFADAFEKLTASMGLALLGKDQVIRLTLTCLVSGGHLLLEDLPGTGKTMLARRWPTPSHGSHARIQFTPDLLPTDVTGVTDLRPAQAATSSSTPGRSSPTSCSPTRSTAPRRRRSRRCSR